MPQGRGRGRGSGGSGGSGDSGGSGGSGGRDGSGTGGGGLGGGHGAGGGVAHVDASSVGQPAPATEALSTPLESNQYEEETAGGDAGEQEERAHGQQDDDGCLKLKGPLDASQFGDASPVKESGKRGGAPRSQVWALVKRLKDEQLKGEHSGGQTPCSADMCLAPSASKLSVFVGFF